MAARRLRGRQLGRFGVGQLEGTAHLRQRGGAARMQAAQQGSDAAPRDALRARANSLVMRAGQAALTAAKGAGFVVGHPAGQAVSEALFFLVWSCPQAVAAAGLCELAGMAPAD